MNDSSNLGNLSILIGLASKGSLNRDEKITETIYRSDQWRAQSAQVLRRHFLKICQALKPGVFLELGAHGAEASVDFVAQVGGRAIAIEANPYTFESVTKKAERYGVEVRNAGVGAKSGKLDMHIPLLGASRSITPVQASFLPRTENVDYQVVSVEMTTLEEIVKGVDVSSGLAIWIDVEGLAQDVINGGQSVLRGDDCLVVMVEVEGVKLWRDQVGSLQVDKLMSSLGFVPIMRDAEYEFQFNIVYVKEYLLGKVDNHIIAFWSDLTNIQFRDPRSSTGRLIAGVDLKGRLRRAMRFLKRRNPAES